MTQQPCLCVCVWMCLGKCVSVVQCRRRRGGDNSDTYKFLCVCVCVCVSEYIPVRGHLQARLRDRLKDKSTILGHQMLQRALDDMVPIRVHTQTHNVVAEGGGDGLHLVGGLAHL